MGNYTPSMELMYKRYKLNKEKDLSIVNSVLFLIALGVLFIPGEIKYYIITILLITYVYRKFC
jgi:hypothetical protein